MATTFGNLNIEVLAQDLLWEQDKVFVFANDCDRKYEAILRKSNQTRIKIPSFGGTSVTTSTIEDSSKPTAEKGADSSIYLDCNKMAKFNIKMYNIDEWLSKNVDLQATLLERAKYNSADSIDQALSLHYADAYKTIEVSELSSDNVVDVLLLAHQYLRQYGNVPDGMTPILTVSPAFMTVITKAKILTLTDNAATWTNGYRGMFGGMKITSSNNVYKDVSNHEHIMCRTKEAIKFATIRTHMDEPVTSSTEFAKEMAGYTVYGSKTALPKEIVHIDVTAYHDALAAVESV